MWITFNIGSNADNICDLCCQKSCMKITLKQGDNEAYILLSVLEDIFQHKKILVYYWEAIIEMKVLVIKPKHC